MINQLKKIIVFSLVVVSFFVFLSSNCKAATYPDMINIADEYIKANENIKRQDNARTLNFEIYKQLYGINYDVKANSVLANIISKLTDIIAEYDQTVKVRPYNYFVNDKREINAFCFFGHNITVNIGVFKAFNYNEDEIAFVVGHELAHGTNRDSEQSVLKNVSISSVVKNIPHYNKNIDSLDKEKMAKKLWLAKAVTYPMEKVADAEAFNYCSKAGYNVGAGAAALQKLIELEASSDFSKTPLDEILSPIDHPGKIDRRDEYNYTIYEYSNYRVYVDVENGTVFLNNISLGIPVKTEDLTSKERAFLIAGRLAAIYHLPQKDKHRLRSLDNRIYVDDTYILTLRNDDSKVSWLQNLNKALNRK